MEAQREDSNRYNRHTELGASRVVWTERSSLGRRECVHKHMEPSFHGTPQEVKAAQYDAVHVDRIGSYRMMLRVFALPPTSL